MAPTPRPRHSKWLAQFVPSAQRPAIIALRMSNDADEHRDAQPDVPAAGIADGEGPLAADEARPAAPPSGYAFSLGAILLQITLLAGIFAVLKAMSVRSPERWMIFMAGGMGVVTWWALSIRSAQYRERFAAGHPQRTPAEIAQASQQEAWDRQLTELAPELGLDPESLAFLIDTVYFAPNYFDEEDGRLGTTRPLTENRLLVAVVRYARECFGEQAEQQLSDWGLHNRDRLAAILRELVAQEIAAPGTLGYEIRLARSATNDVVI